MKEFNIFDIEKLLGTDHKIIGNTNLIFTNVQPVEKINKLSLDWIDTKKNKKEEYLKKTVAPFVICDKEIFVDEEVLKNKCIIISPNPKMTFSVLTTALFKPIIQHQIHENTVISTEAKIGKNVHIDAGAVIGKVEIGNNSYIGKNTIVNDGVRIGNNVLIGCNNTIGMDGFGYERGIDGALFKFPHIASVIIEDNVEVGNNTCIDRGALSSTLIKKGTKIDNLVHIAHNVEIGENCCIIANCVIAGSVKIGNNSWIAPNSVIREHINIGNNSLIGLGAIVTKAVDDNKVIAGFPALPFNKMIKIFKKLIKM